MSPKLIVGFAALLGAAAASPVAYSALTPATGTLATAVCEGVGVSGVVNKGTGVCVPYAGQVTCDQGSQGLQGTLVVNDLICWPTP